MFNQRLHIKPRTWVAYFTITLSLLTLPIAFKIFKPYGMMVAEGDLRIASFIVFLAIWLVGLPYLSHLISIYLIKDKDNHPPKSRF